MHPCLTKSLTKVLALAATSGFRGRYMLWDRRFGFPAAAPRGWKNAAWENGGGAALCSTFEHKTEDSQT